MVTRLLLLDHSFFHKRFLANKQPLITAIFQVNHPSFPVHLHCKCLCHLNSSQFIRKDNPSLQNELVASEKIKQRKRKESDLTPFCKLQKTWEGSQTPLGNNEWQQCILKGNANTFLFLIKSRHGPNCTGGRVRGVQNIRLQSEWEKYLRAQNSIHL